MQSAAQESSVVAIYDTHDAAEAALIQLQKAGIDMTRLSIAGKNYQTEEHAVGFYTSNDRMRFWGGTGAIWGALWGVLVGSAFFFVPVVGPLVVMGPLVGSMVMTLEGAAVGGAAGVLSAALVNFGIPKDSVVEYELEVKAGKFLVIARGPASMVEHARAVLGTTNARKLTAHAA